MLKPCYEKLQWLFLHHWWKKMFTFNDHWMIIFVRKFLSWCGSNLFCQWNSITYMHSYLIYNFTVFTEISNVSSKCTRYTKIGQRKHSIPITCWKHRSLLHHPVDYAETNIIPSHIAKPAVYQLRQSKPYSLKYGRSASAKNIYTTTDNQTRNLEPNK